MTLKEDLSCVLHYLVAYYVEGHYFYLAVPVSEFKKFNAFPPSNLPEKYSILGPFLSLTGCMTHIFYELQEKEFRKMTFEVYT